MEVGVTSCEVSYEEIVKFQVYLDSFGDFQINI